jgi:hypothetical protein
VHYAGNEETNVKDDLMTKPKLSGAIFFLNGLSLRNNLHLPAYFTQFVY